MNDSSPNGLDISPDPGTTRMRKWPLYAACGAALLLLAALIYSVSFSHRPAEQSAAVPEPEHAEDVKPLVDAQGQGVAGPLPGATAPAVSGAQKETPDEKRPPVVVVQKSTAEEQRVEQLRRTRSQSYMSALSSPLVSVRRTAAQTQANAAPAAGSGPTGQAGHVPPSETYDPAADRDKEAFFERARKDTSWQLAEQRTEGMPYELKTGSVVPGVMLTGVNSDLPGNMIAQVAQNIFDTATGRHLLIPQGSRLYGIYDSRVVYGQERVLIAWNRLIYPDGSSITLGAMPGADMGGIAGLNDQVNNHYLRIFGSALMMSLVSGGMAYAMDSTNDSTETDNGTRMSDEMTSALAAQLGQATTTLLQRNLSIKPTLEIRPGYQFNIIVTKDIIFRQPYTRWRQ